jgi:polysaccharide pyruvyl transferase CsaB
MKRIVISGYYGYGNIGDEAILEAFTQQIKNYPGVNTTVISSNPAYTFKTQGLKAVSRGNPFSIIKAIVDSDLFIQGGGGIIQDSTSFRSPYYYLGQLILVLILMRRFYIMGQGIGPIRNSFTRFLTRETFAHAKAITVRDLQSQSFLLDALATGFDLTLTADLALLLEKASNDRAEDILFSEGAGELPEPVIAVSIKGNRKDQVKIDNYTSALNNYLDEVGGSVLFIPFFNLYDLPFTLKVMSGIRAPSACIRKDYKPSEILALYCLSNHVLAGRLHSSIFAALAGIPFSTIAYDPKINAFLHEIDLETNLVASIAGAKSIEEALINDMESGEFQVEKVKKRLPSLQKRAQLNISKLLELLQITD